ncbi:MAG TPA: Gfo/Idh/MocA family oxidoreductase [Candidatus Synoicihabitans sp.]|nr:Gfo/Idh/MocA family oxidoreductase [Candidatus Synoicihabitans sp.]
MAAESPTPSRKLGVALVGLGSYSTGELAPALEKTRWCHLTGVVTGDREKGERWARQHKFPVENIYNYETLGEIASNRTIDIVYIVTPPGLHARDAIAAARSGKHVICEKPMANTVAECDAIIAACRDAGVKLSIGYRLQFDPFHQEIDRLAQESGPLREMAGGHSFPLRRRVWRLDKQLAGGGPLMDVGIYVIQAACRAAGGVAPVAVTARERPKSNPDLFKEVEETIEFTLHFPQGQRCEGITSYAEHHSFFQAAGPNATIELQPAYSYRGIRGRTSAGELAFAGVPQQALQMDDFARAILDNRPTPVGGEMGRMHLAVIEAIYEAARTGRRVDVAA